MDGGIVRASVITAPGEGGIGIIALTGPEAAQLLDKVFVGTKRRASRIPPGSIAHGTIRRGEAVLDEVIVAHLAPEGRPTAEPYFEVNCHGGVAAVQAVLGCLKEAGAQVLPWRQFTDGGPPPGSPLSQVAIKVRAIALVPRAPTRLAAAMLLHQADGALSREVQAIGDLLTVGAAQDASARLDDLLRTARLGRALLRPPKVALLGPPNVGKSTLLNTLLEEERVIVHHEPGTTRDVVAETVSLRGVPFELLDSAGIRATQDDMERCAVRRAADLGATCDVALLIFDAREGIRRSWSSMPAISQDAETILVGNKIDLLAGRPPAPARSARLTGSPVIYISARDKTNIDQLESALLRPYEDLIEHCRGGGAVLFDTETEEAVRQVRDHLATDGPERALGALRPLCAERPVD